MALGSTQPLTEMSTRSISWGKGDRCIRLTILPPSCAVVMKSGNLKFLEPFGPLQACNGLFYLYPSTTPENFKNYSVTTYTIQLSCGICMQLWLCRRTYSHVVYQIKHNMEHKYNIYDGHLPK